MQTIAEKIKLLIQERDSGNKSIQREIDELFDMISNTKESIKEKKRLSVANSIVYGMD